MNGARVRSALLLACAAGALAAAAGCGSSASTSVTAPTTVRCAVSVAPAQASVAAAGGSGSLNVSVNRECAWNARAEADWIALTSPASGQGEGAITFTAAPNPFVAARRASIVVNETRFDVSQAGAPCVYRLGSTGTSMSGDGGSVNVSVTADPACSWTATSNAPWLVVAGGRSGSGAGVVTIDVAANPGAERTGTVTIAGQTFTVLQGAPGSAAPPSEPPPSEPPPGEPPPPPPAQPPPPAPSCSFSVSPTSVPTVPDTGGTGTIEVSASGSSCAWTASSSAGWLTITSGSNGSGNGSVAYRVAANTGSSQRTATLTVAGRTITIRQSGAPGPPPPPPPSCSFTVSPTNVPTVSEAGGEGTVEVSASDASCVWSASSSAEWLVVTSGASGTGNGSVGYRVALNTDTAQRTATLTVAGRTLTVRQSGAPGPPPPPPPPSCSLSVAPTSVGGVAASGAEGTIAVTASDGSCSWSASSSAGWITITSGTNGSGNGEVRYRVDPNTGSSPRTGTMVVAGQTVTVSQEGAPAVPVTLAGRASSVAGSCPAISFRLADRSVVTNGETRYSRGDCEKMRDGREVLVEGVERGGDPVLAVSVEYQE